MVTKTKNRPKTTRSFKVKEDLGEMFAKVFSHAKSPHLVLAEDLGHLFVGLEILLVLWILELMLLDVGPELFDALAPGGLLLADNVSEFRRQLVGLGESGTFWHYDQSILRRRSAAASEEMIEICVPKGLRC